MKQITINTTKKAINTWITKLTDIKKELHATPNGKGEVIKQNKQS